MNVPMRLEARIRLHRVKLQCQERLWSTARLTVFLITLGVVLFFSLKTGRFGVAPSWVSLAAGLITFAIAVMVHHRVVDRIARYDALETLIQRADARRGFDWKQIPELPEVRDASLFPRYFWDLDLFPALPGGPSVLRLMDCTFSSRGWTRLVEHFSVQSLEEDEVLKRQRRVEELIARPSLRRRFLLSIGTAPEQGRLDESVQHLLNTTVFPARASLWLLLLFGLQILMAIGTALEISGWTWFPVFLGYGIVFFAYRSMQARTPEAEKAFDHALSLNMYLERLLLPIRELERWHPSPESELCQVLMPLRRRELPSRRLQKLGRILSALSVQGNPIFHLLINLVLPWDLFWARELEKCRAIIREEFDDWLNVLAEMEAAVSLAEFNDMQPGCVRTEWLAKDDPRIIETEELCHPLISPQHRVGNGVCLDQQIRCNLITGSNMSGKSTYLRTIGVNALLARAGARVPAQVFRIRNFDIGTCLRITDSVTDQISSFYAEVLELKKILDLARTAGAGKPALLYLIDEIFRGTNHQERLKGSRAYVRELLRLPGAAGMIASHDLELSELARENPRIINLHFQERIENGRMEFDYRVRTGPSDSTNALKIMELAGLPIE